MNVLLLLPHIINSQLIFVFLRRVLLHLGQFFFQLVLGQNVLKAFVDYFFELVQRRFVDWLGFLLVILLFERNLFKL